MITINDKSKPIRICVLDAASKKSKTITLYETTFSEVLKAVYDMIERNKE